MSWPAINKMIFPMFAIVLLLLSAAAPALATSSAKAQPTVTPDVGPGSPSAVSKKAINVTSGSPLTLGQVKKIGDINTPPAIVRNLTAQVKSKVNETLLRQAKKLSDDKIRLLINQLELYKKRITYSGLSDDQKAGVIAVADTNIAWFREIDIEVQAAGDLDTVRALMAQVDQQADSLKVSIKKDAGVMACDGLDARIATARDVSTAISGKIAALKAQGKVTGQPEAKLADYDAHLDAASQYSAAARTAFLGITSAANANGGFASGYRQIGLADREMSKAYADLKDVYLWYLQNGARA